MRTPREDDRSADGLAVVQGKIEIGKSVSGLADDARFRQRLDKALKA
jgi:hypothetical protein